MMHIAVKGSGRTITGSPICTESIIHIPVTSTTVFNSGNVFTAQPSMGLVIDKKGSITLIR